MLLLLGRSGAGGGAGQHRAAAVPAHPGLRPRAALPGLRLAPGSRPPAPRHRRHPLHPPRQHPIAHISVSKETRVNHNIIFVLRHFYYLYHVLKSGSESRKCRLLQNVSIVMQLCRAVAGSVPLFLYGGCPVPVPGIE